MPCCDRELRGQQQGCRFVLLVSEYVIVLKLGESFAYRLPWFRILGPNSYIRVYTEVYKLLHHLFALGGVCDPNCSPCAVLVDDRPLNSSFLHSPALRTSFSFSQHFLIL